MKKEALSINNISWQDSIRMLLNFAAEQPDPELLLQKHFTALLSSVWRTTGRCHPEYRQNVSSSRYGVRLGGRFLSHIPQGSAKEPAQRMKFTNLRECSNLLSAALHDASNRQRSDAFFFPGREDSPVIAESLEITLEIQRESGDFKIPFPPVINLSIYGSNPVTSKSKTAREDLHLKASKVVAENRFRYSYLFLLLIKYYHSW